MGFSRQEYWSGLPFPSPGDFADPGIEPRCSALQADCTNTNPLHCVHTHTNLLIRPLFPESLPGLPHPYPKYNYCIQALETVNNARRSVANNLLIPRI